MYKIQIQNTPHPTKCIIKSAGELKLVLPNGVLSIGLKGYLQKKKKKKKDIYNTINYMQEVL